VFPTVRCSLIKCSETKTVLKVTFHHSFVTYHTFEHQEFVKLRNWPPSNADLNMVNFYSGEFCTKNYIVKTSETLIMRNTVTYTAWFSNGG